MQDKIAVTKRGLHLLRWYEKWGLTTLNDKIEKIERGERKRGKRRGGEGDGGRGGGKGGAASERKQ